MAAPNLHWDFVIFGNFQVKPQRHFGPIRTVPYERENSIFINAPIDYPNWVAKKDVFIVKTTNTTN